MSEWMGRDTKVGRLRARALTLLITSPRRGLSQLTYVSGTLVRDPEGRVHFFFLEENQLMCHPHHLCPSRTLIHLTTNSLGAPVLG